jgi:glycosyltransferase involved in cell wall biosynthesis
MKVSLTYFLNSIALGGMETHAVMLARGIDRDRYDLRVIIPTRPELDPLADDLARYDIPTHRLTLDGWQPIGERWASFWALVRLLRAHGVDVMHQQRTGPFHGEWACLAAKVAGVPVIVATEHQSPPPEISWRTSVRNAIIDRLVDCIIVVSEASRRQQLAYTGRTPSKVVTIHNGISIQDWYPRPPAVVVAKKRELGLEGATPVVGTVGRLAEQKGLSYFLRMAALLLCDFPAARFVIVGDGPQRDELVALARDLGIADRVIFAGFRTDVPDLMSAFDLFVLASVFEPFGLVLVEAMALEKPVVASRVNGIPEVVADGEAGLLVPPRDPHALAEAAARLLRDQALARRMGQAGRGRVLARFTVEAMAGKTMALYEEILARKRPTLVA